MRDALDGAMTTLTTTEIKSLKEYTEFVEQLTDTRWYRGCASCHDLKPSLYRHPVVKDLNPLLAIESDILRRFRQRCTPYLGANMSVDKDLNAMFIMQHFRVPTRLLDWTENPYIALYFALNDSKLKETSGDREYTTDVCVWVLDPVAWNNKALDFSPPPGIIYSQNDEYLSGYLPTISSASRKPDPVALYGIFNNPRIVVQRGVFTLFGAKVEPMERIYRQHYPPDSLRRLIIKKQSVGAMLSSLTRIGVTDSTIFPDLEGLARELRREFGYLV